MKITRLDHLVLTVTDIDRAASFYAQVLGFELIRFDGGRMALRFGDQKINLQAVGNPSRPVAACATPGSSDLCFVTEDEVEAVLARLEEHDVPVLEGPVTKTGALGPMVSVYFRDPDGNLLEVSRYGTWNPRRSRRPGS